MEKISLEKLNEDINYLEMQSCNHYFVIISKGTYFDGHTTQTDYINKCIHCGLTDKYLDGIFPNNCLMNKVIREGGMNNFKSHGYCVEDEIKEVKKIYDRFKNEYKDATDEDIENYIALVRKMKGDKLC